MLDMLRSDFQMRKTNHLSAPTAVWLNHQCDWAAEALGLLLHFFVPVRPLKLPECQVPGTFLQLKKWHTQKRAPSLAPRMASVMISIRARINAKRPLRLHRPFLCSLTFVHNSEANGQKRLWSGEGQQPGTPHLINVTATVRRWSLLPGRFIAWVKANYFLFLWPWLPRFLIFLLCFVGFRAWLQVMGTPSLFLFVFLDGGGSYHDNWHLRNGDLMRNAYNHWIKWLLFSS